MTPAPPEPVDDSVIVVHRASESRSTELSTNSDCQATKPNTSLSRSTLTWQFFVSIRASNRRHIDCHGDGSSHTLGLDQRMSGSWNQPPVPEKGGRFCTPPSP